jgi:hypothetical protein
MERSSTNDLRRILLAVTETSPLVRLWHAVAEHLADTRVELITVFVSDDRWHRAASLPFTREISRIGRGNVKFTPKRAEQIDKDVVDRTRIQLQRLADEAELEFVFEVLRDHQATQLRELVGVEQVVLIAPSHLQGWPVYAEFARLNCPILLVDTED